MNRPFDLITAHPLALDSNDHLHPRGTRTDNTHHPPFVERCEELFPYGLTALDLGCAGGGLVYDFVERGHRALGLEGSDYSLIHKRACWSLIPDHLKTCDITKPFVVVDDHKQAKFRVICAWETLEHIAKEDLPQLFKNIYNHLSDDGFFVASVAQYKDEDNSKKIVYHHTLQSENWWIERFRVGGLIPVEGVFTHEHYVRGAGHFPEDPDFRRGGHFQGFHLTVRKR